MSGFIIINIDCTGTKPPDGTGGGNGGGSTPPPTFFPYKMLIDGNPSDVSSAKISTDYDTLLFLENELNRKIYIGGRVPGNDFTNYQSIWLTGQNPLDLWDFNQLEQVIPVNNRWNIGGTGYYWLDISIQPPEQIKFDSDSLEKIYFDVGIVDHSGSTPSYNSEFTDINVNFRVAQANARDFRVNIYQQTSHAAWDTDFGMNILKSFNDMRVRLIPEVKAANLDDQILENNVDYGDYLQSKLVQYALQTMYPTQSVQSVFATYLQDHPQPEGFIFFVDDYYITPPGSGNSSQTILGLTQSDISQYISAPYYDYLFPSFIYIFSGRIDSLLDSQWETIAKRTTTGHELGHLWCKEFTDEATHTYYHTGNNQDQCLMLSYLNIVNAPDGYPSTELEKQYNFGGFCEGHLQRGMNVSWNLHKYQSFGSTTNNKINFIKNGATHQYKKPLLDTKNAISTEDIKIQIDMDDSAFIKGELFDVYVTIENKRGAAILLPMDDLDWEVTHVETQKKFTLNPTAGTSWQVTVPAYNEYIFSFAPTRKKTFTEENRLFYAIPGYYWREGNYILKGKLKSDNNVIYSNPLPVEIKPVPDSLLSDFELLKVTNRKNMTVQDYERLLTQHKNTFFEYEYYIMLFETFKYIAALENRKNMREIRSKILTITEEFVLKYPNSYYAFYLIKRLHTHKKTNREFLDHLQNRIQDLRIKGKLDKQSWLIKQLTAQKIFTF